MSHSLQIAKGLSTEILVVMADRQEFRGRFFLADNARNHYGQEHLFDVLNDSGKAFLPFCQEGRDDVMLVRKSRILGLQQVHDADLAGTRVRDDREEAWQAAEIALVDFTLVGRAYTGDLPPDRRRLADLLNHGDRFLEFETGEGPWIVNKDLVNYLVPLA